MDDRAEFTGLVRAGVIGHLPATPVALRLRGWVEGAEPGDPVVEGILAIKAMEQEVSDD